MVDPGLGLLRCAAYTVTVHLARVEVMIFQLMEKFECSRVYFGLAMPTIHKDFEPIRFR